VLEVLTGDTLAILPNGEPYDSESRVKKLSLASIRAPRAGNEKAGRADEPFCQECKERLRVLTVGKPVKVDIHYEREIPLGENTERRQFGTVSVGKRADVAEVLVAEGLAVTQRHRDEDEKSPRYDELRAAEEQAKNAKKGVHSESEYKKRAVNDLTDPRKAKAYSGSLMRAGTVKAVVEFVLNGGLFKLYIPSENCHVIFAPNSVRCPQPTPPVGKQGAKAAEPFGDASKRHARYLLLQRNVEIVCTGVTPGGVITGQLFFGQGAERRDYSIELVGAGLATVDARKIEYGEAPRQLVDAQSAAQANKVGIWSIEQVSKEEKKPRSLEKSKDELKTVRISEIRAGNHFFFHVVGDDSVRVMDESMKLFTKNNGTSGAPCDVKVGKVVAALFDDGTGKSWYRAKIIERKPGNKASVLFLDHGNVSTVSVATNLRPLDVSLGTDRIPPAAREATLALTVTRPVEDDEGVEAAQILQDLAWGKDLTARIHATDDTGKLVVTLLTNGGGSSVNEELIAAGFARVAKPSVIEALVSRMVDGQSVIKLAADLNVAQESARKSRVGIWRYGDIGDEDDEL
jgi:staphylococcal nuclease domain-containing protein 1